MMHEFAHRIPESTTAKAVGLVVAATPIAIWAARHFTEKLPEAQKPESPLCQVDEAAEVIIQPNPSNQPIVVYDLDALRTNAVI